METWKKVRALRERDKATAEERRGKYAHLGNSNNVFKGLLICDDCGSKLIRYKGVNDYFGVAYNYICPVRAHNLDMSCTLKKVHEKDIHELVHQAVCLW